MVFDAQVIGARETISESKVTAYRVWINALSVEEFEASLLPLLTRMAKRSPESGVKIMAWVISMLSIETGSFAPGLAKEMLSLVRHAKETVR